MTSHAESTTTALYSVMIGSYEQLNEQPEIAGVDEPGVRRVLLTDDPHLRSDFWEVVLVERAFADDPVRSQRLLKIVGHESLDECSRTLYVDNAVTLRTPPGALLDLWLGDHDMAVPLHSYRDRLVDEFDEIVRLQYDDPARVYEQLLAYSRHHASVLDAAPLWTAILARRRTPSVHAAMEDWARHLLRYSRRDQLSAPLALAAVDDLATIPIDNMESEHHRWPTDLGRRIAQGKAFDPASGPLLVELRRRDRRIEELEASLARAQVELKEVGQHRDELGSAGASLRDDVAALEQQLEDARAHAKHLTSLVEDAERATVAVRREYERSQSWRLTAPLRALRRGR